MTAEEFYLDEHKGVFYSDPVIERAIFRFAEAYAEHENERLSNKTMMSIFSEYINKGNGAIDFHAEYSPKYPFCLISLENYQALQKQIAELKELLEFIYYNGVPSDRQFTNRIKQALKE